MPFEVSSNKGLDKVTEALERVGNRAIEAALAAEKADKNNRSLGDAANVDELNAKLNETEEALAEANKLNLRHRNEIKRLNAELDNMKGLGNK